MLMLIGLDKAKAALGISQEDTSQNDRMTALIGAASELIEAHLRRKLQYREYIETLHQCGACLNVKAYPVDEITRIEASGIELSGWTCQKESGLLFREGGWPLLSTGIQVTYTGGYQEYPHPLQQACLLLVMQLQKAAAQEGSLAASERIGDYSISYVTGAVTATGLASFSPAAAALVHPYMGRYL